MTSVAVQAELVSARKVPEENEAVTLQQFQQTYVVPAEEGTKTVTSSPLAAAAAADSSDNSNRVVEVDNSQEEEHDNGEISNGESAPVWDLLASCSILFLWFQRSTFGILSLMRSLVLGHCLQLLFQNVLGGGNANSQEQRSMRVEDHNHDSIGSWIRTYLAVLQSLLLRGNGSLAGGHGHTSLSNHPKSSSQVQSWPPPALVALAVLTIFALIVHPDGMTWVVLIKIRDTMTAILNSSTTCWAIMIRDYGVVGTVSASASIVVVLILAIAMHKAFLSNWCGNKNQINTSKRRNHVSTAEKKRRRRKGHHSKNNGGASSGRGGGANYNRIKGGGSTTLIGGSPSLLSPRLPKVEEVLSDGACDSSSNSGSSDGGILKGIFEDTTDKETLMNTESPSKAETDKNKADIDEAQRRSASRVAAAAATCFASQEEEGASITISPSALESVVSAEECEMKGRTSVPPVCTVDTAAMADDISCGSISVRSIPTPRQVSSRTNTNANNNANSSKGKPSNSRGGKNTKTQRGQKQSRYNAKANSKAPGATAATSKTTTSGAAVSTTSARFDSSKKQHGHRQTRGNKGRGGASHNSRGKGGRHGQKNQHVSRMESPLTMAGNNSLVSVSPSPKSSPTSPSGNQKEIFRNSSSPRVPPASPFTQSLFSCEVGASGWSIPALPVVSQSGNPNGVSTSMTTPPLSYQTNTFVTPYSGLPTEYNGSNAPAGEAYGLWNSGQTHTLSPVNHSNLATPQRPMRAPPGLPAPPGLAKSNLPPTTPNAVDLFTPVRSHVVSNDAPSMIPATPSFGTPRVQEEATSPFSWSGNGGVGVQHAGRAQVKDNPFAADTKDAVVSDDNDCRIEAELQELGGRMIGSVLDF